MSIKKITNKFIPPYHSHIHENIIWLEDKKLLLTFLIEGIPYESLTDDMILNNFNGQKETLLGLCKSEKVFLWEHLIKRDSPMDARYKFPDNPFLQRLSDFYCETFNGERSLRTEYFITTGIPYDDIDAGEKKAKDIIRQIETGFKDYNIYTLGISEGCISDICTNYLNYLLNHDFEKIPLSATKISESIKNSKFYFSFDTLEIKNRNGHDNKFCSNYIVKDVPRGSQIGQWNFLLSLPFEFILTQSFIPDSLSKSSKKIEQQLNKLTSVKDAGKTQQTELHMAQEAIINQETVFGSWHSVLSVFGNTPDEASNNGSEVAAEFVTSGRGFRFVRATSEAPYAWFSHLPASTLRPLATQRTLSNVCCLMPLHNHSYGKKSGNPIGDGSAIMPLKTVTDGLYWFNTHYSAPGRNVTGQMIAGHAMLLGATGAGKTTFEMMAAAFLQRFNPDMFVIDFNRSTELAIRMFGGQYFSLAEGVYSGLNPFQIGDNDDPELMAFLKEWVKRCAVNNDGSDCSDSEAEEIDRAVEMVMKLERRQRRFARLQSRIQNPDLNLRLSKWWDNGALSWATDSEENKFDPDKYSKIGFDTTVILETVNERDHPACEVILSVLFFYKKRMQKGGKLMLSIVEEFWKPCNYPMTQALIKASLKAGRMKGEMMWLTSQSPEDAINCQIFAALVQQTPTKILLPNPDAKYSGYKEIGLTEKEFRQLKKLKLESRTMLIKQSGSSAFAKMDLVGFDDFLPVISCSMKGIKLCEKIREEIGSDDPELWYPPFIEGIYQIEDVIREANSDIPDVWLPFMMKRLKDKLPEKSL
ncbi:VirB4 family type IV secretion/conjugal transfer ATPase [Escherichia coli]|uniref:VirB4 family type IV secretion/conjugal transfer ATPase n=1 Tax=Escherichia coli TaxID=562 RepID=UPI0007E8F201|nr:VirB4 family type IV secretion system protein [Escherichia coli]